MHNLGYKRRVLWYFPEWPIERGDRQDREIQHRQRQQQQPQTLTMFLEGKRKYKRAARRTIPCLPMQNNNAKSPHLRF